ncbi:ATP-binding protein [Chloroflexota bacterium]
MAVQSEGELDALPVSSVVCIPAQRLLRRPCPARSAECTCSNSMVSRYQKRISGPLLDRIDMQLAVWAATLIPNSFRRRREGLLLQDHYPSIRHPL